jgi:hypothetical protein
MALQGASPIALPAGDRACRLTHTLQSVEIRKHLTYANVVATLALFVALGGGAYAVSNIASGDIKNDTIRSADLRDRKAVKGADVKRDALGGKEIAEQSLDAARFVRIAGDEPGACDPSSTALIDCAAVTIDFARRSRLLAFATGGQRSASGDAKAECEVQVDGTSTALRANPGEQGFSNTAISATNGFARTLLTPDPLAAGTHEVSLACNEVEADVRIEDPTIAAIAIATK